MADLVNVLAREDVHPEDTAGPQLPLKEAAKAYDLADKGQVGKVGVVFED